jgi:hypothetical protein
MRFPIKATFIPWPYGLKCLMMGWRGWRTGHTRVLYTVMFGTRSLFLCTLLWREGSGTRKKDWFAKRRHRRRLKRTEQ